MSFRTSVSTPKELTEVLRELCSWPLIETLGADGEESVNAIREGLGYLTLNGRGYDTQLVSGTGWHTYSLALALARGNERFRFRARAEDMDPPLPRSGIVLGVSRPGDYRMNPRVNTSVVDVSHAICNLRTHPWNDGCVSVKMPPYTIGNISEFEVARLESPEPISTARAHARMLRVGQALLDQVTEAE